MVKELPVRRASYLSLPSILGFGGCKCTDSKKQPSFTEQKLFQDEGSTPLSLIVSSFVALNHLAAAIIVFKKLSSATILFAGKF